MLSNLRYNRPCLGLIGNPENRRIYEFQNAVEVLGWARPACLAYEQILEDPARLERFDADILRIDSPGENDKVARALIARGGGPPGAALEFGEIAFLREYHEGFCAVLKLIEQRGIPCLNVPLDICQMFDKWASHQRFVEHGIARPPSELAPTNFAA